jgi:hypothetical protein
MDYKFLLQTGIPKRTHVTNSVSNLLIIQMDFLEQPWFELDLICTLLYLIGRLELLNILRAMSNNVRVFFSATPFWYGEPGMVYWATILFS